MSGPESGQPTSTTSHGEWPERRALLATCVAAAVRGGGDRATMGAALGTIRWEEKSQSDFVSDVDRRSEAAIGEVVRERHSDARLLGEEFTPEMGTLHGLVFVADPLDGTTNFLHGFPWYAVSIAAVVDGTIEAGAVLNAATGELFTAIAGGGARRAGQPISVSTISEPSRALIGTGFPFKQDAQQTRDYLALLPALMGTTAGLRAAGGRGARPGGRRVRAVRGVLRTDARPVGHRRRPPARARSGWRGHGSLGSTGAARAHGDRGGQSGDARVAPSDCQSISFHLTT